MRRHRMNHFDEDGFLTHKGKKLYTMFNNKRDADHVTLADFEANFEPIDPELGLKSYFESRLLIADCRSVCVLQRMKRSRV